jgi:hypothetical protein
MTNKPLRIGFVALLVLSAACVVAAQDRGDRVVYKDTIVVAVGESRENIIAFGSDVVVEGLVKKTVLAIGGSITVSGTVGEAVVGIGSRIKLLPQAKIDGDLVMIGGSVAKEPGSSVSGDTVSIKFGDLTGKFFGQGFAGLFSLAFWPLLIILKLVNAFIWLLVAIVVAALFPRQVVFASGRIRRQFWPIFGTGFLALVIFTVFVVFAAVLCLVLIGIPILLSLVLAGLVVKIFGKVVIFFLIGESLARAFNRKSVTPVGGALLGLFLLTLISFAPFLGFLVSTAINILGWGVALRTKFGTQENWFHRGPHEHPVYPGTPAPPAPPAA